MKKIISTLGISFLSFIFIQTTFLSENDQKQINNADIERRVDSVLSLISIEEKAGQLNQLSYGFGWGPNKIEQIPDEYAELIRNGKIGSFLNAVGVKLTRELQRIAIEESRLKIPLLFGLDVIHGFKCTFPVPLAEASSWDPDLIQRSAALQAKEAASSGIHWTFAPMVDIARDPRWGRIVEGSGEDPFLGSAMAAARVRGFQRNLSSNKNIIACAKHFAAYGGAEGGRDYNTVDISERTLREIYLPPFKAAVDAGVQTLMCSFNEISGIPSSSNKFLLTDILRNEWNFNGFVVSDWNSIGELVNHGVAANLKEAARLAINAGVDMDMESRSYVTYLGELIKEGKVSEDRLDEAVRRILRIKFKLGLFDNPYKYCSEEAKENTVMSEEIQNASLLTAQKSIVLLKNQDGLLPLKKDIKTIAVIGPFADSKKHPLGSWAQQGDSNDVITLLEGIKMKVPNTKILHVNGCTIKGDNKSEFPLAIEDANNSDVVILALGEEGQMSGEARSRASIELPGVQNELAVELFKIGKPIIVVLMNGRPLAINWIAENIPAVLECWFLGTKTGQAIADVIFGDVNPGGKLPVTFPRATGQIPIYYNYKNTGRPGNPLDYYTSKYLDLPLTPLFPFGHGLSYTNFSYDEIQLNKSKIKMDDTLKVSVNVKNTGNYDGEEVVQLYIQDVTASITRPVKELKGFKKIFLKKGESRDVEFTVTKNELSFYDASMNWTAEPGTFKVFAGSNSVDVQSKTFELEF